MGCVLGSAGVDRGEKKGKLPKVVRPAVQKSDLDAVWLKPKFHRKQQFLNTGQQVALGCNPCRRKIPHSPRLSTWTFQTASQGNGAQRERACVNDFRKGQQVDRTE